MKVPTVIKFIIAELAHKEFWLLVVAGATGTLMLVWRTGLRDEIFRRAESFKWSYKGR